MTAECGATHPSYNGGVVVCTLAKGHGGRLHIEKVQLRDRVEMTCWPVKTNGYIKRSGEPAARKVSP